MALWTILEIILSSHSSWKKRRKDKIIYEFFEIIFTQNKSEKAGKLFIDKINYLWRR